MFPQGTGWIPDQPDARDYGPDHKNLTPALGRMQEAIAQATTQPAAALPVRADLTPFFPPVFLADYLDLADFGLGTQQ